jgi:hypothetical protein
MDPFLWYGNQKLTPSLINQAPGSSNLRDSVYPRLAPR